MLKKVSLPLLVSTILCAEPSIIHTPSTYLKPEHRTTLTATIEDAKDFSNKRLYFKAKDAANFSFVNLSCEEEVCSGVLPKASADTLGLEYLFLIVDSEKKVYKTPKYAVPFNAKGDLPQAQENLDAFTPLVVMTEMDKKPTEIEGFSDNIIIDTAESTARYGAVAGLYAEITATAAATTVATSVTTLGATTAAAGISTTTVVLSSVAVVAAGAGAAVALSGDDEEEESAVVYAVTLQGDAGWNATVTTKGDSCSYTETSTLARPLRADLPEDGSDVTGGSCTLTNTNDAYTFKTDDGATYTGTASSDGKTLELIEQGGSNVLVFTRQ